MTAAICTCGQRSAAYAVVRKGHPKTPARLHSYEHLHCAQCDALLRIRWLSELAS